MLILGPLGSIRSGTTAGGELLRGGASQKALYTWCISLDHPLIGLT